jgi:hypothetical protein
VRVRDSQTGVEVAAVPLPTDAVVKAWDEFVDANEVDATVATKIKESLAKDPWARVFVPGDARRLGSGFHRKRLWLLVDHVKAWFEKQGKVAGGFDLAQQPRARTTMTPTGASPVSQDRRGQNLRDLRRRLKEIIDQMSAEQLYQLRIPVEYLDK